VTLPERPPESSRAMAPALGQPHLASVRWPEEVTATVAAAEQPFRVLIVAEVRFLRDALAEIVMRDPVLSVSGLSADLYETLNIALEQQPNIVLLDAAFPNGTEAVRQIINVAPRAQVIVFAIVETEENVIAWAEAGVVGYVPRTAALADLLEVLADIMRGEQSCSGRIAGSLLRRVSKLARVGSVRSAPQLMPTLSARELQIIQLVGAGLSNKDIARRLNIGVATTKSHVHNLLGKLALQRRGQVSHWIIENKASLDPASQSKLPE
jgi:two-component system nitrate/nitrite response regulator NarL